MIGNVYINVYILSELGLQQIGFGKINAKSRVQTLLTLASLFLLKLHYLDKCNILILQESHDILPLNWRRTVICKIKLAYMFHSIIKETQNVGTKSRKKLI